MKHLFITLALASIFTLKASATQTPDIVLADSTTSGQYTKAIGDSAYAKGDYASAIHIYESILAEQGEAAALYYNVGNAYYKDEQIAKAILNYERALLLDPSNKDIQFNLELAQSKAVDKNMAVSELFFVQWYRSFTQLLDVNQWGTIAILCFLIFITCLTLFIFSKKTVTKKIFFIFAIVALGGTVLTNVIASGQRDKLQERSNAIIMEPSVTIRSTPSESGTELFILHEGKKVKINDDSMKEWKEIEIEDGNIGWLPASAIEKI